MTILQKSKLSHLLSQHLNSFLQPSVLLLALFLCPPCLSQIGLDTQGDQPLVPEDLSFRLRRAPFRPPSVTSFEPSVKKVNGSSSLVPFTVPGRETLNIHPQVRSRIESVHPQEKFPDIVPLGSTSLSLPSSPYATSRRRPTHKPLDPNKKEIPNLVLVQNDQQTLEFLKKKQRAKIQKYPSQHIPPRNNEQVVRQNFKESGLYPKGVSEVFPEDVILGKSKQSSYEKSEPKFPDLHHVRKAINMTNEKLQSILKLKSISINSFVEFVENGATKNEIQRYLNVKANHHDANEIPYNNVDFKSKPKILTDLPFTEIVHQIPPNRNYPLNFDEFRTVRNKHEYAKKESGLWESGNVGDIVSFIDQKITSKENYDQTLSELDRSLSLPPKDSPMSIHHRPPIKKDKDIVGSASIAYISMEEKKSPHQPKKSPKIRNYNGSNTRSTPESSGNKAQHTSEAPLDVSASKAKDKQTSKSQIRQNNMRFVFPMKGILIFCAILGGLAFITILMFIAYAALKCNKRKSPTKKFHVTQTDVESA